jgi:hypothetical protein
MEVTFQEEVRRRHLGFETQRHSARSWPYGEARPRCWVRSRIVDALFAHGRMRQAERATLVDSYRQAAW